MKIEAGMMLQLMPVGSRVLVNAGIGMVPAKAVEQA